MNRRPFVVVLVLGSLTLTAGARERNLEETFLVGYGKTIQEVAREAARRTVAIRIHVGERMGFGSGALLSADGLILTCAHVIEPGQRWTAVLPDGREFPVRKLGMNSTNDYALVKIAARGLSFFPLGRSADLHLGDWVVALGHPGGPYRDLQPAVAVGRVTGLHKKLPIANPAALLNMKFYNDAIRTDTAIFSGNSGGPLVNLQGQLVGINGAIMIVNDTSYSTPIDQIKRDIETMKGGRDVKGVEAENLPAVFEELYRDFTPEELEKLFSKTTLGRFFHTFMGSVQPATGRKKTRLELGLDFTGPVNGRLVVRRVEPGRSAGRAGVLPGDVLMRLGGFDIHTRVELLRVLSRFRPGNTTLMGVRRGSSELKLLMTFNLGGRRRANVLRRAFYHLGLEAGRSVVVVGVGDRKVGYGVLIDRTGYVLTNDRIVRGARDVQVKLHDGEILLGRVVGRHGLFDVALLKVDPGRLRLHPAAIGSAASLRPGSWVVSGGGALGPRHVGSISALGRTVEAGRRVPTLGLFGMFGTPNKSPMRVYTSVIQHDTDIDDDDFGMPLFDVDGKLVGLTVASFYRGTAFASPVDRVVAILDRLKRGLDVPPPRSYTPRTGGFFDVLKRLFGESPRRQETPQGYLGVQIDPARKGSGGVHVKSVIAGSAAARAGIAAGDVIAMINDQSIRDFWTLRTVLSGYAPRTRVTVVLRRRAGGKWGSMTLDVILGSAPVPR